MDAQSAVTANCIRTLCKEGKVHCVLAGTKVLVDLDHLLEYLSGSLEKSSENAQELA